jgi:K+-transporting ATPase KdpF subunit
LKGGAAMLEYLVNGSIAALLLVYLLYALVKPERF